jgi:hypothetical protein
MPKAAAMAKAALHSILLTAGLVGLSGCSTTVDHPSLAPRAIERFSVTEPEPAPPQPAPLPEDASRQERASALVAQAVESDARFRERLAEAKGIVASGSGAAPGSEAWVQAQQAISRVETLREPVSRTLADLDALQIAAADSGVGTQTESELNAAIQRVVSIDTQQEQDMATLRESVVNP